MVEIISEQDIIAQRRIEVANMAAKALAEGKEPFDYQAFAKHYSHDTGSFEALTGNEPESTQLDYARDYYQCQEAHTIDEFVDIMNALDVHGCES